MNKTIVKRQKEDKERLLKELEKMPIIQTACVKAGIARATYYRWKKRDKKFAQQADSAIREGVALMNDYAESQLISAIRDKNMTAIIYWLKNRHQDYSTKIELSGSIKTTDGRLTTEQQALLDKAIGYVFKESESNED